MLTTVGIISLLAVAFMVGSLNVSERSRDTRRIKDIDTIKDALELYYIDHGEYPPDNTGWEHLCGNNPHVLREYMDEIPCDPINFRPPPDQNPITNPSSRWYQIDTSGINPNGTIDNGCTNGPCTIYCVRARLDNDGSYEVFTPGYPNCPF